MKEVYRTNNPVELSYLQALMEEVGLDFVILDAFTSMMEGSIGAIQRRVLVADDQVEQARLLVAKLDEPDA